MVCGGMVILIVMRKVGFKQRFFSVFTLGENLFFTQRDVRITCASCVRGCVSTSTSVPPASWASAGTRPNSHSHSGTSTTSHTPSNSWRTGPKKPKLLLTKRRRHGHRVQRQGGRGRIIGRRESRALEIRTRAYCRVLSTVEFDRA